MQSDRTRKELEFFEPASFLFFKLSVGFSAFETHGSIFKLTRRKGIMDYGGKKIKFHRAIKNFIQLKTEHISFYFVLTNIFLI